MLLVTNDDGIGCVFLHELVRALIAAGHDAFVVAPKVEQSWTGASKSRHRPVRSEKADIGLGCPTWVVDGTPSDCVNIGIDHLLPAAPEAVLSGLNVGLNASLGFILGSGTVAGACEGALHGLPGIALSQSLDVPVYEKVKEGNCGPDEALLEVLRSSARHAALLAPRLAAPLGGFYQRLQRTEARHCQLFLRLARTAGGRAEPLERRLGELAAVEAELITAADEPLRFHAGPPRAAAARD